MDLSVASLQNWYSKHEKEIIDDFFAFLRFKGISTDPHFKDDCINTALFLRDYLTKIGMNVTLWENPGMPVVFAEHKVGSNRPTVLIYQHYDVQPVDPIELWNTDPFEPKLVGGTVFARGASDNKGQCFATSCGFKSRIGDVQRSKCQHQAFYRRGGRIRRRRYRCYPGRKKELLKADHVLVVDFDMPKKNKPGITLGMRGIATFDLVCQNSKQDLHSGVHGGIALNPIRALAEVMAKMWDENGTISIEGFYSDVLPVPDAVMQNINLDFDLEGYKRDFGVMAFSNEKNKTIKEANWLRPSLEINGISGGYTGVGFKTVIPAKAYAKLSCRLVPGQDPHKVHLAIDHFLKKHSLWCGPAAHPSPLCKGV
jgi:acetylornithine deacetylase/succinyl-diaminopimelate desuccinylase-like protein